MATTKRKKSKEWVEASAGSESKKTKHRCGEFVKAGGEHTCQHRLRDECSSALRFSEHIKHIEVLSATAYACKEMPKAHAGMWDFEAIEVFREKGKDGNLHMEKIRAWIDANKHHPFVVVTVALAPTQEYSSDHVLAGRDYCATVWYHPCVKCVGCGVSEPTAQYLDPRFEDAFPHVWALTKIM